MLGGGVTNADGGLTMTGNLSLLARTLNNPAAATYGGVAGNAFTISNSTFNNLAGGTLTLDGNNDVHGAGSPTAFNNLGTFVKRAGATGDGVTSFGTAFNNSGLVELQTGTLSLEGAGVSTSTGDFVTQAGTTLQLATGGTHNFNAGAHVTVAGLVVHGGSGTTNFNAGSTYTVTGAAQIVSGTHNFNTAATAATLLMTGGTLGGSGTVNVSGPTTWSGGVMLGGGVTNADGGLTMTGNLSVLNGRTLNNAAIATYSGVAGNALTISNAIFNNLAGGTLTVDGNNDVHGGGSPTAFNNLGTFVKRAGAAGDGVTSFTAGFNNSGVVDLQSGTLSLDVGGTNAGAVTIASAGRLTATSYTQSAGSTSLAGGALNATSGVTINGGSLTGSGTVTGNVTNAGGQVSPGVSSPGTVGITGNYNQGAAGVLNIEIGGPGAGTQFDQLNVVGGVGLGGTLNVALVGGFAPNVGDTFIVIANDGGDAVVGTFAGLAEGATFTAGGGLFRISYVGGTGNDVVLTALAPPNTPPSNLVLTPSASAIDEGGTVTVNGSFTDPDAGDAHTVVINWGPGEGATTLTLAAGVTTFSAGHLYPDDSPTGTAFDIYPINVTVSDASAGTSAGTSLTVNNLAPDVTITGPAPGSVFTVGTPITFTAAFADAGPADTHTAAWTFDAVTTAGSVAEAGGSGTVSGGYTFTAPG
ncbi:MAG TPA: hypothetical protein VGF55_30710, partial [Gemmataceae bacterium]